MSNLYWKKLKAISADYFNLHPYLVSQQDAEQSIRDGVSFRGTNLIILVLAIFIASLGLNTNSTAVIIGAMLISPLMGPIIGIGLGIGITDFPLLKRSARNLLIAAIFSMLASTIYFLISPVAEGHSELLARTSPTIYDVLIGFFGGGAGIVAIGSRSKGNVIPGVAIATALMPPLCTAGYGLATLQMNYFIGATYLFLINSIFICLATFIGVKLMGYKAAATQVNPQRAKRIRRIIYTLAILALLPSIWMTYLMLRESRFQINANRFVAEECQWPSTHVLTSSETLNKDGKQINLTLIGKAMPQDSLTMALSARLKFYNLEGTKINIFQGDYYGNSTPTEGTSAADIYQISQSAINQKQEEVDSLRNALASTRQLYSAAAEILPEVKVIFPKIKEIAITKAVFANPDNEKLDTLSVALIHSPGLSQKEHEELQHYLQARLKIDPIKVLEIPAAN